MSGIDKWSQIDGRTTAHWWLGAEGTACGLDFHSNIQRAYADDPRCRKCLDYLAAVSSPDLPPAPPSLAARLARIGSKESDA